MLLADRIQIQQVVTNLILNSTEVMESVEPEMRKLIIELSTAPSTLRRRSLLRQGYGGQALRVRSGQAGEYYFAGGLKYWKNSESAGRTGGGGYRSTGLR